MTITALACPADEPPEWLARFQRNETGPWHAPWCFVPTCDGTCPATWRVGPVQMAASLPRDSDSAVIALASLETGGLDKLRGPDAAQLARRLLAVATSEVPPRWLRKQPS